MKRLPSLASRLLRLALVLTFAGSGCAPETFSLDDCGRTCGSGPFYLFDQLQFLIETDLGLDGFDLDGEADDCDVDDGISPAGLGGIDNQFGAIWDVLPDTVEAVVPEAIDRSIESGTMMVVMELVGAADLETDGPTTLVFRQGVGTPLVGTDRRPLSGQTVDLVDGDNILGMAEDAVIAAGQLAAEDLSILFRLEYIDTLVELFVVRGQAEMRSDGVGGLDMKLGGMVPLDAVMDLVQGLGGDGDKRIREALEALVPLMVDTRTDPEGDCDGLSGAFLGHASPVFLFEE